MCSGIERKRRLSAFARLDASELRRDIRHSAPAKCARGGGWLGGRDSNPDNVLQRHASYRWTTSQSLVFRGGLATPKLSVVRERSGLVTPKLSCRGSGGGTKP